MAFSIFEPYRQMAFPCFWLPTNGTLETNAAALAAEAPLNDAAIMEKLLRVAGAQNGTGTQAFTLPLLTDAASTRILTLMPMEEGLLAIAVEQRAAPVNALSGQMRESLTNIFAVLPLLVSRLEDSDQRYTSDIQANCYCLLRLASNLENASRIERKLYDPQPLDLAALVESLCSSADAVCGMQGVPIHWQVPSYPIPVRADTRILSEAFLNLLRNSLQFTRDGNEISVTLVQNKNRAVLTVADKGTGIPPQYLSHVFEPYYSMDPYGESEPRPGLGLGLASVRETMTSFGGTATAESVYGEGTRIHVGLPVDNGDDAVLGSRPADYLLNRYSPVYVQLCGFCELPGL